MAQPAESVAWSAGEKRRLLDYIRDRKAKNSKASPADFAKTVVGRLDGAQASRATPQIVQEQVTAIIEKTRQNGKHTAENLWKSGPKILKLNHPYLRGVYTSKEMAEISGVKKAGPSGSRKRKGEDSINHQKETKRSRRDSTTEESRNESSDQEGIQENSTSSRTAVVRKRTKRKAEELIDDQKKTKRSRHISPTEISESDYSSQEDNSRSTTIKTALPKKSKKRARAEESCIPKAQPAKKQKTGSNNMPSKETHEDLPIDVRSPEKLNSIDDQSETEQRKTAQRLRVTLKVKGPEVKESGQHDKEFEQTRDHLDRTEDGLIMPNDDVDNGLLASNTAIRGSRAQALQGAEGRSDTQEAAAASTNLHDQATTAVQARDDSVSPEPWAITNQKELVGPPKIPRDYLQFGLDVSPPRYGKIPEDLHIIYNYIMGAVHDHLGELNIELKQPVLIKDRAWDDDLAQLMGIVFGHQKTPEALAKDFATIQSARTLPLHLFLRSLCAAAVMEWVFEPEPLGFSNDSGSRDAVILNAFRQILTDRFNEGVMQQMFFEAGQYAIKKQFTAQLKARAAIFAHRLFMALSPFFQSSQINHWTHVNDPRYLRPLTEAHKGFNPEAGMKNPATRDVQTYPESDANESPLPGSTNFERHLRQVFEKALKTRYKWVENHDAEYSFDFPLFKEAFQEGYHFNEEYVIEKSTANRLVSTDLKNRVFIGTMFGVRASSRIPWTNNFTDLELVSRPSVFNLD